MIYSPKTCKKEFILAAAGCVALAYIITRPDAAPARLRKSKMWLSCSFLLDRWPTLSCFSNLLIYLLIWKISWERRYLRAYTFRKLFFCALWKGSATRILILNGEGLIDSSSNVPYIIYFSFLLCYPHRRNSGPFPYTFAQPPGRECCTLASVRTNRHCRKSRLSPTRSVRTWSRRRQRRNSVRNCLHHVGRLLALRAQVRATATVCNPTQSVRGAELNHGRIWLWDESIGIPVGFLLGKWCRVGGWRKK